VQIYRISALEKDRNTPLYSRRSEFRKDYCELEELDLKGTNDRKAESEYCFSYQVYYIYIMKCLPRLSPLYKSKNTKVKECQMPSIKLSIHSQQCIT